MNNKTVGACFCGEVSFHYTGDSLWCAHCHCSMCQRAHGAPLVTWVGVAENEFHLNSDVKLKWFQSSPEAQRGFCSSCGTTLFFRSSRWPGEMHIVRTNIEGEIDKLPMAHVFWESHARWFGFEDNLPKKVS